MKIIGSRDAEKELLCLGLLNKEVLIKFYTQGSIKLESHNVVYQRVAHITEWLTFPYYTTYKLQHAFFQLFIIEIQT